MSSAIPMFTVVSGAIILFAWSKLSRRIGIVAKARILQTFCIVFVIAAAAAIASAVGDIVTGACGPASDSANNCTNPIATITVFGTAIFAAIWFFLMLRKVKSP